MCEDEQREYCKIQIGQRKTVTIDFEEYFKECEERNRLRQFMKMVKDGERPVTQMLIDEYLEAAGLE